MTKVDGFNEGVKKLEVLKLETEQEQEYMSDMAHWCIVHATKYVPRKNKNGAMYIPSTAMATDFEIPRSTVHTTLNHIVAAHGYGSWDDAPIIVMAPYNDIIKQNGNPAEVAGTDTYWSANPDTGLVLPESTYIIQPDDNGPLFQIGEHGATYKRDNYTDEEVAQIESMLDSDDRVDYMKYKNGEIEQWDIEHEFYGDERVKKMYDSAKDKQAFLRGLFEESRFAILSKYLRDAVVRNAMNKIGFQYIDSIHDCSNTSEVIAKTAEQHDVPSNPSNKGHSNSLYALMEDHWGAMMRVLQGSSYDDTPGLLKQTDTNTVYDVIAKYGVQGNTLVSKIVANIINNKPIDFEQEYRKAYEDKVELSIDIEQRNLEYDAEELNRYETGYYSGLDAEMTARYIQQQKNKIDRHNKLIKNMSAKKTITDYDKKLDATIRRHCERLSAQYNAWRNELAKQPDFSNLVQKLQTLVASQNLQHSGRDEF